MNADQKLENIQHVFSLEKERDELRIRVATLEAERDEVIRPWRPIIERQERQLAAARARIAALEAERDREREITNQLRSLLDTTHADWVRALEELKECREERDEQRANFHAAATYVQDLESALAELRAREICDDAVPVFHREDHSESRSRTLLRSMLAALDSGDDTTYFECFSKLGEVIVEMLAAAPQEDGKP